MAKRKKPESRFCKVSDCVTARDMPGRWCAEHRSMWHKSGWGHVYSNTPHTKEAEEAFIANPTSFPPAEWVEEANKAAEALRKAFREIAAEIRRRF